MTATQTLIAFHGEQAIKEKYLARIAKHREMDELVRGATGESGKGCAVWCTLNHYNHAAYETELGIPRAIARLEDGLFESLPIDLAMEWPSRFLAAIRPGADLSLVLAKWLVWLLVDPADGVIWFAKTDRSREAITCVANLYTRQASGEAVSLSDFKNADAYAAADAAAAAAAAAYAAAADAADAYAAAAYAADAAAAAAAADADAAADAAAYAAAAAAADAAAADAADAAADAAAAAYAAAADAADAAAAYAAAYAAAAAGAADAAAAGAADAAAAYAAAAAAAGAADAAAAYAAAAAGAADAARDESRVKQANKLIELLEAA